MKSALLIILLFTVQEVISQNTIQQKQKLSYKILELNHGLGHAKMAKPTNSKDSSVWKNKSSEPFKVIHTTDSVPAKLNSVFGIEFKITGKDTSDVRHTKEWIYPTPMKENDGRKYRATKTTSTISTRQTGTFYYTMDEPYELLTGKWTLNIYIEDELSYSHTFIAY